jgi:hypothetical protein
LGFFAPRELFKARHFPDQEYGAKARETVLCSLPGIKCLDNSMQIQYFVGT